MVARVVWDHEAAGSSPVTSTRLSLDAIRVLGSAFLLPCHSRLEGALPLYRPTGVQPTNMAATMPMVAAMFCSCWKGAVFVTQTQEQTAASPGGPFFPSCGISGTLGP